MTDSDIIQVNTTRLQDPRQDNEYNNAIHYNSIEFVIIILFLTFIGVLLFSLIQATFETIKIYKQNKRERQEEEREHEENIYTSM